MTSANNKQMHVSGKPDEMPFDGFVVAIGASAGGLEALERFFTHCPPDTGAAFVVIQHLSPDHKSMMTDLLARYTSMKVRMVEEDLAIDANQIFLIPPASVMRIQDGRFRLTPKHPHLLTLPIDIFFISLAENSGSRSIGVILSGTGSDGTRGAAAINTAGGFLLAQEPRESKFDGMPGSVIATGLVDAVLSADHLAPRIVSHMNNLPLGEDSTPVQLPDAAGGSEEDARHGIINLLLQSSGIDFNDYKPATLNRRMERRMQVRQTRTYSEYLSLLRRDINEVAVLRRELLIPVTGFFRDAEVFESLTRLVIQDLVANCTAGPLRVWVAGCSTGEEAYSIGIAFFEAFEKLRRWPSLKIFATDVNQHNIEFAAAGRYTESAAAELTTERLERFFTRTGNHYFVKPELRQCIVFARHNLLSDPPFTKMMLVSCRNTLIYFTPEAQKRALDRLEYAIEPKGFLLLGTSESLASHGKGYEVLQGKHKIFRRTEVSRHISLGLGTRDTRAPYVAETVSARRATERRRPLVDGVATDEAMSILLESYMPPAILVNEMQEAVHFFGRVQPFFRAREGSASLALSHILPENIVPVASALLFKAAKERMPIVSDYLRVRIEGQDEEQVIRLSVRPMQPRGDEQMLLLVFEPCQPSFPDSSSTPVDIDAETAARVEVLQRELEATRESLQATIEELETSNEELQATNEELMASNEELQSSNEELQSVNEELNTVNAEYQETVGILNRINADLDSMSKAVGVATVFVDGALNLNRFSPDAVNVFRLREGDIGRPLEEIVHVLQYPELISDLRLTIDTGRMHERHTLANDGREFLVRLLPYSIPSTHQNGAVATFIDISATLERDRLQAILDGLPEHIAVLSPDGTIMMVNAAWNRFATANGEADLRQCGVGSNYLKACGDGVTGPPDSDAQKAYIGIKSVLEGTSALFSLQYPCHSPTEKRWFLMNAAPIRAANYGAVVSHINISAWYLKDQQET